jgi:NADH-quinone oxidoreductase subunit J
MEPAIFYLCSTVAAAGALGVVVARKVFYSAISLIVCLAALAGLYMLLQAPFIAAVQVIVYAGAIMVLFLFVIMLLDPFSAAVLADKRRYLRFVGIALGLIALFLLLPLVALHDMRAVPHSPNPVPALGTVYPIGKSIFTDYLLPFEATSALILVAIIGAVVLAKRHP